MRLLITSLLALLAAIGLGLLLARDSVRVILSGGDWTVQTSMSFFAVALALAVLMTYFIIQFVVALVRFPRSLRHWSGRRRARRSEQLLAEGLIAMLEHDWRAAERAFRRGVADNPAPILNFLFAARAAQQQGAPERRDHYLQLAREQDAAAALAIGLTRAEFQLDERQFGLAYETLRELDANAPGHDQVKRLLFDVGGKLQDWPLVLKLLPRLVGGKLLPEERVIAGRLEAWVGLLRDAGSSGDLRKLEAQWEQIPKRLRRETRLLEVYAGERLKFPDNAGCEALLRRAIVQGWDKDLVLLYGRVAGVDAVGHLKAAEAWLAGHERDAALLLTLGRLARRCGLWGKARSYLEACVDLDPKPDACRELAIVLEQMGEHEAAAACHEKGLKLVTGG